MPEKFDVIIVGAGIAGLSAAIEASEHCSIALIDRFDSTRSNSWHAQGGIAVAMGKGDSWKKHSQDTIKAGCGLCDADAVEFITKSGPAAIKELMDFGLEFDGGRNPEPGLEGGHSEKRVLHIKGDQTGKEMTSFMRKIAMERRDTHFLQGTFVKEIIAQNGAFAGIRTAGNGGEMQSNSLVLATGGYAACFEKTTNPETTLGCGIAMAERAGCALEGMEFVQFHPTTLRSAVGSNFLVSEAVRGEGGKIVDGEGKQIVNPLDTRDKVSIAIYRELMKGGKVYLDARELRSDFSERFPMVHSELERNGISPENDLIPIEAAAHYTIGGVKTGMNGQSTVKGIYAAGECTNSGLHGANRLASNSLLGALVMGKVAGKNAAAEKNAFGKIPPAKGEIAREGIPPKTALDAMKKVMWKCCGIVRDEANLRDGLAGIKNLEGKMEIDGTSENATLRGALLASRKTFEAALARKESIGAHYRIN